METLFLDILDDLNIEHQEFVNLERLLPILKSVIFKGGVIMPNLDYLFSQMTYQQKENYEHWGFDDDFTIKEVYCPSSENIS